jgi:zinc transport system ATP-binding protein
MNQIENGSSPTLQVLLNGRIEFQSYGKWLYPLFEFEKYLKDHPFDISRSVVKDKIIGKAAAFLILHLGAGQAHGVVMSRLATDVFDTAHIPYTYDTLVNTIECKTEQLLENIYNIEDAYQILHKRAFPDN